MAQGTGSVSPGAGLSDRPGIHPVVRWVPNALTATRIALLPVFVHLLTRVPAAAVSLPAWSAERAWAAGVLLVMGVTDYLDGLTARRLDAISRLGSVVDAVADRLALLVPLLYFALASPAAFPTVGLWIPMWLIGVDVVTGIAWLAARSRYGVRAPIRHNLPGRVATWIYFALLLGIVAGLPGPGVVALAVAALGLSTVSSGIYIRRWWRAG